MACSCNSAGHRPIKASYKTDLPAGAEQQEQERHTVTSHQFISSCYLRLWGRSVDNIERPRRSGGIKEKTDLTRGRWTPGSKAGDPESPTAFRSVSRKWRQKGDKSFSARLDPTNRVDLWRGLSCLILFPERALNTRALELQPGQRTAAGSLRLVFLVPQGIFFSLRTVWNWTALSDLFCFFDIWFGHIRGPSKEGQPRSWGGSWSREPRVA